MKPALEKLVKGVVITGLTAQLLLPVYSPFIGSGQYLNAQTQTTSQEQKKKKEQQKEVKQEEDLEFTKAKEYLKKINQQEKKTRSSEKSPLETRLVGQSQNFGLKPVNFDVIDKDGNVTEYRQVTSKQAEDLVVKIYEGGKILLREDENKNIDGFEKDIMVYYKDNVLGGHAYQEGFDFKGSGVPAGTQDEMSIQMEKGKEFRGAIRLKYLLLQTPDPGPKVTPPAKSEQTPGNQTSDRQTGQGTASAIRTSKTGHFLVRGGALIGNEVYSYDDCDCEEAFSGAFVSTEYLSPNIMVWGSILAQVKNEGITNYGGTDIHKLFQQANIGLAARKGIFYVDVDGRFSKHGYTEKDWMSRTYAVTPLPESTYQGVFGTVGLVLQLSKDGEGFEGSFIRAGVGGGYGNVSYSCVSNNLMFDHTYDSDGILEKVISAHLKTPLVELKYSQSQGDNAQHDLKRKTQTGLAILKLPLGEMLGGKNSFLRNLDLIGEVGIAKVKDSILDNYENKWFAIGLQYEGKRK
jgi:hypothetical protein